MLILDLQNHYGSNKTIEILKLAHYSKRGCVYLEESKKRDAIRHAVSELVAVFEAGQNRSQVARQLNSGRYTVRCVYQRYQATGTWRRGSCRKSVTTQHDGRLLVTILLQNCRLNSVHLGQQLHKFNEYLDSKRKYRKV
ncbi:hypothetical protein GQX74_015471 [Glossina fuscipes]|nr:hypothetical protein GQX74_015471 [Glossina fuscipes]